MSGAEEKVVRMFAVTGAEMKAVKIFIQGLGDARGEKTQVHAVLQLLIHKIISK